MEPGDYGDYDAGGGAKSAAVLIPGDYPEEVRPGEGYLLSEIPGVDSKLFPASLNAGVEYGRGGVYNEIPAAHTGQGGPGRNDTSNLGSAGVVILRYAATPSAAKPELAATGSEAPVAAFAGFAALIAAGAALIGVSRRPRATTAD